jgi:hypothetical protein
MIACESGGIDCGLQMHGKRTHPSSSVTVPAPPHIGHGMLSPAGAISGVLVRNMLRTPKLLCVIMQPS